MRWWKKPLVITGIILCFLLVVFNLNYNYSEVVRNSGQVAVDEIVDFEPSIYGPTTVSMAGWPFKYSVTVSSPSLPPVSTFSFMNLLANLMCALAVIGAIFAFEYSALKRSRDSSGKVRRLSLLDLLAATAVVALGVVYWRSLESAATRERILTNTILSRGGQAVETLSLPNPLVRIIPAKYCFPLRRISEVTLTNPDNQVLKQVLDLPFLSKLFIGGGNYDLKLLERLRGKPLLTHLRISGRKLDANTVSVIASLKPLQSLNLTRTNITDKAIETFGGLPRLQALNVIHTDVEFKELPKLPITRTIHTLKIGHPPPGQTFTSSLTDWPNLSRLECNEFDERPNSTAMQLKLRDMPSLVHLSLDAFQTFDLEIAQAPNLGNVDSLQSQAAMRLPPGAASPTAVTIRKLKLDNTPLFSDLQCSAEGLEELQLGNAVSLTLLINGTNAPFFVRGTQPPKVDREKTQRMLDQLGGAQGPVCVRISDLDLSSLNLDPLFTSSRIRELSLRNCRIAVAEQLRRVIDQDSLIEELDLTGNWVTAEDVQSIVKSHSNLRVLLVDFEQLRQLTISDAPKLERLLPLETSAGSLQAIRAANLPLWMDHLETAATAEHISLENVPELHGLTTHGPWPASSKLSGLRELRRFAAGGPNLNDAVFQEVLKCPYMESLTLAYCSISPDTLAKIAQFKELKHLSLGGPNVTDALLGELKSLTELESLVLNDTAVTEATLDTIVQLTNLKQLSIDTVSLTPAGLGRLNGMSSLVKLRLGGTISADHIKALQALPALQILDLSGCNLDRTTLVAIASLPRLEKFAMRECQISEAGFTDLVRQREIIVDATNTDIPLPALSHLQQVGRLIIDENDVPGAPGGTSPFTFTPAGTAQPSDLLRHQMRDVMAIETPIIGQVPIKEFSPQYAAQLQQQLAEQAAEQTQLQPGMVNVMPMSLSEAIGYWIGQAVMGMQPSQAEQDLSNTIEQ